MSSVQAHPRARTDQTDELERLARSVGQGLVEVEVLRHKRHDVMTARAPWSGGTVILKLWNRRGVVAASRRLLRNSAPLREWRALRVLHDRGVSVPAPLHYFPLRDMPYTDALVIQDVGQCVRVTEDARRFQEQGLSDGLANLEESMVSITAGMVRAGVLDLDHTAMNFVLTPEGRVVRLDLELARCVRWLSMHTRLYAWMLARLLVTYVFAIQPETHRVEKMAKQLADELKPPRRVLIWTQHYADRMMKDYRAQTGSAAQLHLAW